MRLSKKHGGGDWSYEDLKVVAPENISEETVLRLRMDIFRAEVRKKARSGHKMTGAEASKLVQRKAP